MTTEKRNVIAMSGMALRGGAKKQSPQFIYINLMERGGVVYIMTNTHHTTLYTGVTSDLLSRLAEHREKKYPKSFTAKYNLNKLVYYETYFSIEEAIEREKQIKGASRKKKGELIAKMNPEWKDLYERVSKW